jgi:hypothetical protein
MATQAEIDTLRTLMQGLSFGQVGTADPSVAPQLALTQLLGRDKDSAVDTEGTPVDPTSGTDESGGIGAASSAASSSLRSQIADLLNFRPAVSRQRQSLTAELQPLFAQTNREEISKDRTANIDDIARLAPLLQAIREAGESPQATALRKLLFQQIQGELGQGTELTPEQSLDVNENVRSAQFARGFGSGRGSANREAVARSVEGIRLLGQRQSKASGLLSQESADSPNPFQVIGGQPTTGANQAVGQAQVATSEPSLGFIGQNFATTANIGLQNRGFDESRNQNLGAGALAFSQLTQEQKDNTPAWLQAQYGV